MEEDQDVREVVVNDSFEEINALSLTPEDSLSSESDQVWGSRHSGVFLVFLAALRSSKVGSTEVGVYIDY